MIVSFLKTRLMPWEKQFDRDEVLGRAADAFWENGYEATSMEKLLGSMGIQKGSFYATFSSKHSVLIESLNRYILDRFAGFNKLAQQYPPLEALEKHFDDVYKESSGKRGNRGCFLINEALELASRDRAVGQVVRDTLQAHEGFYRKLLATARAEGNLPKDYDVSRAATALLGFLLGMRVLARAGMPGVAIRALRDQAVGILRNEAPVPA